MLLLTNFMLAQEGQRGSVAKNVKKSSKGVKRALVVGIAGYKAKSLHLDYADDDAEIFKEYLKEVEKIPKERLVSLIAHDSLPTPPEKEPTSSNVLHELTKLMDETQDGDTVYFYFAGHGDVVNDKGYEEGFLLTADANENREYYGTPGVIALKHLDSVITTVTDKGAKFVLVLDACRSGFLYKEGTQKNLETFNNNFQHSIKFFSCGPKELSYESSDIGHGYFTYYLVLGFLGAADNLVQDNSLQYFELANFLDGQVRNETDKKQGPIVWHQNTVGVFKKVDSKDKDLALNLLKNSSSIKNIWASRSSKTTTSKTIIEKPIVKQFNKALKAENYYGTNSSALELYNKALNEKLINKSLANQMRHSFVNALSTNAQILINTYIGDQGLLPNSKVFEMKAKDLEVCLKLIEKDAFIYDRLYMSQLFLEAYAIIKAKHYSKYPEAKQKLKDALKIEERAAYIHNALGIVLNHEEKFKEAIFHYQRAKDLIPTWSFPVHNIGLNYFEQHQYSDAKLYVNEALKLNGPKGNRYNTLGAISESQGKYREAEAYYHKVKETNGEYSTVSLRNLAILYNNRGNVKKAIDYYKLALEKNPNDVKTYYGYSEILNDNAIDIKKAEELLKKAIELEPYFSRGHAEYADLLRRYPRDMNSYQEAHELYDFAISNNPFYTWSYAGKGWLYHKQNLKEVALTSFKKSIEVNPQKPKAYYNIATYYENGLKDLLKAENNYLKAIEKDPFYLPAYERLIDLYNKSKQEQKSLEILNTLVKWNVDAPDIWNLLGNTYFDIGDYNASSQNYQKAIKVDSTYAKGFSNLAYSLMKTNKYQEATTAYKLAVQYNPYKNNVESFSKLLLTEARKQNRAGNITEAQFILKEAYNLSDNYETSYALSESYYFNNNTNEAYRIIRNVMIDTLSKTRKIKFLELACKVAIDLKLKKESHEYINVLQSINPRPNYILEALVKYMNKDKKGAKEALSKANPLLLKEQFLTKKFSNQSIKLVKQLSQ